MTIVPSHYTDLLLEKQTVFSGKVQVKAYSDEKLSRMNPGRNKTIEFTRKTARLYAINQVVSGGKRPVLPKKESNLIHSA